MTRRTRSILVDANIGKIFINTSQVTPDDPSKLIAGTKLESTVISSPKKRNLVVANNLGSTGRGRVFPTGALLTSVAASVRPGPLGSDLVINVKVGEEYETSSIISVLTIEQGTLSTSSNVSVIIPAEQAVYLDIVQVGSTRPGQNLSVTLKYYAG